MIHLRPIEPRPRLRADSWEKRAAVFIGKTFARLTVLAVLPQHKRPNRFLCRCECGVTKTIEAHKVRRGEVVSCGCYRSDICRKQLTKHGYKNTLTYSSWHSMVTRCRGRSTMYFKRGIKVCARWESSFENFLADMGERPSAGHSIDRIDGTRGYEPGNCRWATKLEQSTNRQGTRFVFHNGARVALRDLYDPSKSPVGYPTFATRVKRHGWTIEAALITPSRGAP